MMHIILTRHGEADGNVTGTLMGCREGSFLTEKGLQQAYRLGQYLRDNMTVNCILSSPVERAKQTSLIVNDHLHCGIEYFEDLKEIDWGTATGLRVSDIPDDISENFKRSPFFYKHESGESMEEVFRRVGAFCKNTLAAYEGKTILIVSHDNILKGMIAHMKGLEKEALGLKIDHTSITRYSFDGKTYSCDQFNYTL